MVDKIKIPHWLKVTHPLNAMWLENINLALQENPNMSLAEYAELLNEVVFKKAYKRLTETVNNQLEEVLGG